MVWVRSFQYQGIVTKIGKNQVEINEIDNSEINQGKFKEFKEFYFGL